MIIDKVLASKSSNKNINLFLNINFHKSDKIKELIENAGCEILFLPTIAGIFNKFTQPFLRSLKLTISGKKYLL